MTVAKTAPRNSVTLNRTRRVFAYTFNHAPRMSLNFGDPIPWVFGAYHGSEVGFVFDVSRELHGSEHDLAARMASYWTNFAASGNPSRTVEDNRRSKVMAAREATAGQTAAGSDTSNVNTCLNAGGGPCPVVVDVRPEKERQDRRLKCAHWIPIDAPRLADQVRFRTFHVNCLCLPLEE